MIMPVDASILCLSFIAAMKGELKPSHADRPLLASITITYLAITSAVMMLGKISKPDPKPILNTIIMPTKYITSTATPAEPTAGSSIALCLTSGIIVKTEKNDWMGLRNPKYKPPPACKIENRHYRDRYYNVEEQRSE